jgi:hypothetical protein
VEDDLWFHFLYPTPNAYDIHMFTTLKTIRFQEDLLGINYMINFPLQLLYAPFVFADKYWLKCALKHVVGSKSSHNLIIFLKWIILHRIFQCQNSVTFMISFQSVLYYCRHCHCQLVPMDCWVIAFENVGYRTTFEHEFCCTNLNQRP